MKTSKEENSKISEHMYRTGYHFREVIVDDAREILGETMVSKMAGFGIIEPIPESQDDINKQADGAIRDLFPRIPHTDRTMIIEHAFKKVNKLMPKCRQVTKIYREPYSMVSQLWVCRLISLYLVEFNLLFLPILGILIQDTTNSFEKLLG